MNHLILYRVLCEISLSGGGRAVHVKEVKYDPILNSWSHSKVYSIINALIDLGFVQRVAHGYYIPVDIYQWTLEDINNNES